MARKSGEIRKDVEQLEKNVRDEIKTMRVKNAVVATGLKQPDISAWMHKKRIWRVEKILKIAEKLGM